MSIPNKQGGYSLINLIILITLIVIVAAKVIPTYSKSNNEQSTTQKR